MARLILDTGVLIAGVKGRVDTGSMTANDDIVIPAVAVAEYLAGTLLDTEPGRAAAHRAFLDDVLTVVPVHNYDQTVAEHHAALLAHVHRIGQKRGVHDLIIAATARATGRTLVTTDKAARFNELPDVTAQIIAS